jgi:hypothetical protein
VISIAVERPFKNREEVGGVNSKYSGFIDLIHYNCQSEEDLKKIYDKVMGMSLL